MKPPFRRAQRAVDIARRESAFLLGSSLSRYWNRSWSGGERFFFKYAALHKRVAFMSVAAQPYRPFSPAFFLGQGAVERKNNRRKDPPNQ